MKRQTVRVVHHQYNQMQLIKIFKLQVMQFNQNIHPKNEQLDALTQIYDGDNAFSRTASICKVCIEMQNSLLDPDVCFTWSWLGKIITNTLLSSHTLLRERPMNTIHLS